MNKKILVFILAVVILPFVHPTEAQQQAKVPKIGWLGARSASATGIELFRRGVGSRVRLECVNNLIPF
jgi:hypothetical protein